MRTITPASFQAYKVLYPDDKRLQALTLEELFEQTGGGLVNWENIKYKQDATLAVSSTLGCAVSIGYVVFDSICLFLGAAALRASVTAEVAEDMAKATEPVANQLSKYIKTMSAAESTKFEVATAVFGIVSTIYSGGCLGAVLGAFLGSLTWYNAILYGATALGTIVAAVATDGAAEIGIIVVELATAGFLVSDSINCAKACSY
jgi:hypothetical protein